MNWNEVAVADLRYYANICSNGPENDEKLKLRQSLPPVEIRTRDLLDYVRKRGPWLILNCLPLYENTLRWKGERQCTQCLLNWRVKFGLSFSQNHERTGNKFRNYDSTWCMWLPAYHIKHLVHEKNGSFQGLILVYNRVLKNCDTNRFTFSTWKEKDEKIKIFLPIRYITKGNVSTW
jgi:hypothetical protein